jgi:3-hydroxyacyl-CoA dehydrogenase
VPALGSLENADRVGLDLTLVIPKAIRRHLEASRKSNSLLARYTGNQRLGMKTGSWTYRTIARQLPPLNNTVLCQFS